MDPRTFVPHGDTTDLRVLCGVLSEALSQEPSSTPATLRVSIADGEWDLGPQVTQALQLVVGALAEGRPVTIAPQEHLVTPHEAAQRLGINRRELDELIEHGQIPFRVIGRHHRFRIGDIVAYQRSREGEG